MFCVFVRGGPGPFLPYWGEVSQWGLGPKKTRKETPSTPAPLDIGSLESCDALLSVFEEVIHTGLDLLMPVSKVRLNTRDAPWMTQDLKDLIQKRQQVFHENGADSVQFKFYRNHVNRERKLCRTKFYESRVVHTKKEDPKAWWREMKHLSCGKVCSCDFLNHINVKEVENLSTHELANSINKAFLEPLEEYRLSCPITRLALEKKFPGFPRSIRRTCLENTIKTQSL